MLLTYRPRAPLVIKVCEMNVVRVLRRGFVAGAGAGLKYTRRRSSHISTSSTTQE